VECQTSKHWKVGNAKILEPLAHLCRRALIHRQFVSIYCDAERKEKVSYAGAGNPLLCRVLCARRLATNSEAGQNRDRPQGSYTG